MGILGVAGSFNLLPGLLGEGKSEKSKGVTISSFALDESLNGGLPLLDHGACLVSRNVHTVEVGVAVHSFNFHDLELKFSPGLSLRLVVAVSQGDAHDTPS